jgi:hypothetical protein
MVPNRPLVKTLSPACKERADRARAVALDSSSPSVASRRGGGFSAAPHAGHECGPARKARNRANGRGGCQASSAYSRGSKGQSFDLLEDVGAS